MIGVLSLKAAKDVLRANIVGRIGCSDGGKIYVVPVQYVYDNKCIYAHSVEGLKIHIMRRNPDVCFEVDDIINLNNWNSAIAWGKYDELTTEHDRYEAIKLFVDHNIRLKISDKQVTAANFTAVYYPLHPTNVRPVIYRIIIEEITERFEKTA